MMDGNSYFEVVFFEHDYIVINSFGETLDPGTYTPYNKQLIDRMRQRIMAAEDEAIFKILDSIANSGNNDI